MDVARAAHVRARGHCEREQYQKNAEYRRSMLKQRFCEAAWVKKIKSKNKNTWGATPLSLSHGSAPCLMAEAGLMKVAGVDGDGLGSKKLSSSPGRKLHEESCMM